MTNFSVERTTMVDCQVRPSDVTDLPIISAMLEIPREQFLSETQKPLAYIDEDIALNTSTDGVPRYMMEPTAFARLIQLADIGENSIVLDVGCATGYSTAILARLCASVVAVEQDANMSAEATRNLSELEIDNAVVVTGALNQGYAKEGPFDAIFVGGAVGEIPDTLVKQLKDGGKLVVVEGTGKSGTAMLYIRDGDNISKRSYFNCSVWPLPGFEKQAVFVF